jgi:hypothetical protein
MSGPGVLRFPRFDAHPEAAEASFALWDLPAEVAMTAARGHDEGAFFEVDSQRTAVHWTDWVCARLIRSMARHPRSPEPRCKVLEPDRAQRFRVADHDEVGAGT